MHTRNTTSAINAINYAILVNNTCTYIHTYVHTYVSTYVCTYICTTYIRTYIHTYRAHHSTEIAIAIVHNNIVRNIEQKNYVNVLVLLD